MPIDDEMLRLSREGRPPAPGPVTKLLTWVVGGVALAGALVFSAALFAVLLVVGAVVGGWMWWQTRALRQQLRAQMEQMQQQAAHMPPGAGAFRRSAPADGEIIDGDFIREAPATKTDASPTAQQDAPPSPRASAHERRDER